MSGGSYNYLCYTMDRDGGDLLNAGTQENLRRMADRLTEIGEADDAAGETEDLIAMCAAFRRRIEARVNRLQTIWRAVEWMDSGDGGEDTVREALKQYRGEA